jgi:hypothetical protein
MTAGRSTTTRWTLLRLQAALLAMAVIALGGCLAVSVGVARTAEAAAGRSIPATLAAYDAQVAMRTAHREAVRNLTSVATLRDPGSEYRYQITLAGQHLAVVAERNAAGAAGSADIQVIQALLSTYVGLIGVAATNFTGASGQDVSLGLATLLDAAELLDNILSRLNALRDRQDDALRAQATSGWGHPATTVVWLLPVAALVALLVLAQAVLRRRFRRRYSPPLLAAVVLAAALGAATGWSTRAAGDLDDGRNRADQLVAARAAQLAAPRDEAGTLLHDRISADCPAGCEATIGRLPQAYADGSDAEAVADRTAAGLAATAAGAAADASTSDTIDVVLPIAALALMALVLAAFRPRLDEYRYRPT